MILVLVEVVRNTKTAVVKISNTNACSQLTIMKNIIKIAVWHPFDSEKPKIGCQNRKSIDNTGL
mgnify:CR=1 FL=1